MKHPIQPIEKTKGVTRFKSNKIVEFLLEIGQKHGAGLNELAAMPFSQEDRCQLAQLIGYSLCGYSELSYVTADDYAVAALMEAGQKSEDKARIDALEKELKAIRKGIRGPIARLFGIHPDDLNVP